MYVTITNQHLKYYELLFADIVYNHAICKKVAILGYIGFTQFYR